MSGANSHYEYRQVVGHTIQKAGINSTCDGRVHRIDVGLSKGCGDGTPQVRPSRTATGSGPFVSHHAGTYHLGASWHQKQTQRRHDHKPVHEHVVMRWIRPLRRCWRS